MDSFHDFGSINDLKVREMMEEEEDHRARTSRTV